MKLKFLPLTLAMAGTFFLASCSKEGNGISVSLVQSWDLRLDARNEIPAPAGRMDSGMARLQLFSDNSFSYDIQVPNLKAGDMLMAAHLHLGEATANGGVLLDLSDGISGTRISGRTILRASLADSIRTRPVYLNVHSMQVASGVVRGQLNDNITWATDVALSGANEVPANATTTRGTAFLRLGASGRLYSGFEFPTIEAGDMLMAAHIHRGAAGVNGPVLLGLANATADFGLRLSFMLDAVVKQALMNESLYVNVHSMNYAAGAVRGQIR